MCKYIYIYIYICFIYSACRIARRLHRRRVGPRAVYSAPKSISRVLSVGAVQVYLRSILDVNAVFGVVVEVGVVGIVL